MTNYAVEFLKHILKVYSPTGQEEELAKFLSRRMKRLGFKVRIDEVGNVIGRIGSGSPKILLCGHIDTVPGQIPVERVGNKIYGRGAVDAKGPMAAMIMAAKECARSNRSGTVIVAGVVGEEGTSVGMRHLLKKRLRADYAIIGEPSGIGKITIGYRGRAQLKLTCRTIGGHAGAHWLYRNAIEDAYQIWLIMKNIQLKWHKEGGHFYSVSMCPTMLKGGEFSNVVPSYCEMTIDVRVPPPLKCADVIREIKAATNSYEKDKLDFKIEVEDKMEPFEVNKDSALIRALKGAIREEKIRPVKLIRKTGASDMNFVGACMKIPVVAYGPGNSQTEHTTEENIDVQEYLTSIKVLSKTLEKLLPPVSSS
ncbi:MAG TPA: M20/M25/M40 family metallo-hydrolase [archaeon]|nr:M20/M25/M40 family metallo-hydrolase [archaeon]